MSALVSVIVPAYGVDRYLRQCLDSVVGQTYERLDVVLVDDGSPDDCGAVCDEYASCDERVRAFHTENRGLSAARNFGIEAARGEYVLLLDGDDWLEPDAVQVLVDAASEAGADLVCCGRIVEWATGSVVSDAATEEAVVLEGNAGLKGLLADGLVSDQAWDKLYRAELFEGVRYPEGNAFEDISTTYKLVAKARRTVCIPDPLYHYRMREGSISKRHDAANLVDYWHAYLQRYEGLAGTSAEWRRACVTGCLRGAFRVWCWWASCSTGDRRAHRGEIADMRGFARKHVAEVLRGDYSLGAKASCAVESFATPVVWVPLYVLNKLRHVVARRRGMYP